MVGVAHNQDELSLTMAGHKHTKHNDQWPADCTSQSPPFLVGASFLSMKRHTPFQEFYTQLATLLALDLLLAHSTINTFHIHVFGKLHMRVTCECLLLAFTHESLAAERYCTVCIIHVYNLIASFTYPQ